MPDWEAIVRREGPAVWRTAYRLLGSRADADDCFQEAFLDALAAARRGPVRHWGGLLRHLAAARALDRLRERYRRGPTRPVDDGNARGSPPPPPPRAAEDAELAGQLREALARLPARQAEVFCLHCLEGWSYQDIARDLGASVDSVGVLLHRARKQLRIVLADALDVPKGPP